MAYDAQLKSGHIFDYDEFLGRKTRAILSPNLAIIGLGRVGRPQLCLLENMSGLQPAIFWLLCYFHDSFSPLTNQRSKDLYKTRTHRDTPFGRKIVGRFLSHGFFFFLWPFDISKTLTKQAQWGTPFLGSRITCLGKKNFLRILLFRNTKILSYWFLLVTEISVLVVVATRRQAKKEKN
ncbi:hypothetical protein KAFR_0I00450 [Kazachstania africana CBS 2517]|uniref:Uncharacterized protein n=1 Tax=Kazachstania africana (strain ATCC 22294 / BCRC 22015 / CBS 2517 / CECT 1963 / NBRC 1671 / NRRL Y-8276) TaxID=1071382 RepID=H2AZM6_KAZAF|nr:hypothetical protein KAFR_0I00450 [Kazachstania africana CBS 2517]CCF59826.1 hypothetical protein KAFR_0I00450 [Kazachstania africana CBS 2517]